MAIPTSKSTLKEHCLRALGKPVIDVNVDPDQCDDRIDDAREYFAEYHMDGVERMYLKYKMTCDQSTRGQTNATTSNLVAGEVAINTADQKIYVRDSSSNIVEVANKGEALGTVLAMSVGLG